MLSVLAPELFPVTRGHSYRLLGMVGGSSEGS